jgi:hypothetical protein
VEIWLYFSVLPYKYTPDFGAGIQRIVGIDYYSHIHEFGRLNTII